MTAQPTTDTIEGRVAAVQRDLERLEREERAEAAVLPRRHGTGGPSLSYSIRLDRDEVAALESQAAAAGLRPTVLARNLIRMGLRAPNGDVRSSEAIARAADRLDEVVAELRAAVP